MQFILLVERKPRNDICHPSQCHPSQPSPAHQLVFIQVDDNPNVQITVIHQENAMAFQESDQSIAEQLRDLMAAEQPGGRIDLVSGNGSVEVVISAGRRVVGSFDIKVAAAGETMDHYNDLVHLESVLRGAYNLGIIIVPAGTVGSRAGGYQRKYIAAPMKTIVNDLTPEDRAIFDDRQLQHGWLARRWTDDGRLEEAPGDIQPDPL
jgi:hypothetical protein